MILQKKHFYSSKSKTFITIWLVLLPLILTLNIKKTKISSADFGLACITSDIPNVPL
jgi:hypothetical protein